MVRGRVVVGFDGGCVWCYRMDVGLWECVGLMKRWTVVGMCIRTRAMDVGLAGEVGA